MKHIAVAKSAAKTDGHDEEEVDASLTKAQMRLTQWKLHSSEVLLEDAAVNAEDTLKDLESQNKITLKDLASPAITGKKKTEHRQHAARKAVEALVRWGVFEADHGKFTEAKDALQDAVDIATWLVELSKREMPDDVALLVRAKSGQGRALCKGKGHKGHSFEVAQTKFKEGLKLVSEVDALKQNALLSAKIHLEFAECLHNKGEVRTAHGETDAALGAAAAVPAGPEKKRLSQRILKMRALVAHDEGADAAENLYKEYLAVVGDMQPTTLPDPDTAEEYFRMVQNTVIMLLAEGRIDEGTARLDALERLQLAADRKLQSQNNAKFLTPHGGLNGGLWSAMARTKEIRGRLLLASSMSAKSPQAKLAMKQKAHATTKEAVLMMRKGQSAQDLIDGLHRLSFLESDMGNKKRSLALLKEAMKLSEKECSADSMCIASSSHNLAQVLDEMGDSEQALKLFKRGLKIMIKVLGKANPDTVTAYDEVVYLLEKTGRVEEALDVAVKSVESARAAYPEGHEYRKAAEKQLAHLQQKKSSTTLPAETAAQSTATDEAAFLQVGAALAKHRHSMQITDTEF